MSITPGVERRRVAMSGETLCPGSCPPSPGLAPWAILISSSVALARYSAVTPNRPDATCLILLFFESPFSMVAKRARSSPPSPELDFPPIRFIAMARTSCASGDRAPRDIPAVVKRRRISSIGSTSSRGIGVRPDLRRSK